MKGRAASLLLFGELRQSEDEKEEEEKSQKRHRAKAREMYINGVLVEAWKRLKRGELDNARQELQRAAAEFEHARDDREGWPPFFGSFHHLPIDRVSQTPERFSNHELAVVTLCSGAFFAACVQHCRQRTAFRFQCKSELYFSGLNMTEKDLLKALLQSKQAEMCQLDSGRLNLTINIGSICFHHYSL